MGKTRVIAETGAGQHGVATAIACAALGLKAEVYMGTEDCERQRLNVFRMKLLNAQVHPVETGSKTLKDSINEAFRDWVTNLETTYYLIGSVVGPHPYPMIVRDFQSVIGNEIKEQFKQKEGRLPDALVACVGGGSNAMGTFYPFEDDAEVQLYGVEAAGEGIETGKHAASLGAGAEGVFHGMLTYVLQDSNGQIESTSSISAGLDYPGVGPEHSFLKISKRAQYTVCNGQRGSRCFPDIIKGRRDFASVGILACSGIRHEACAENEEDPVNRCYSVWTRRQRRGNNRKIHWGENMNNIAKAFQKAKAHGNGALNRLHHGWRPKPELTPQIADALISGGVDILELGLPFSDPIADGPTIQAASVRALAAGTTPMKVLEIAKEIKSKHDVPVVIMTYYNPMFRIGLDKFCRSAKECMVDGFIVPDLPVEEASRLQESCKKTWFGHDFSCCAIHLKRTLKQNS